MIFLSKKKGFFFCLEISGTDFFQEYQGCIEKQSHFNT